MKSFINVLHVIKDYWFLITLGLSALASVAYMVIFDVNPWDKQRAAKRRHERVRFQNSVGHTLLEGGHYKEAKGQFEEALKLAPVDQAALQGRYVSQLFLGLNDPDWDPAVGLAIRNHLPALTNLKQAQLPHVVEKYLGDVHQRIGAIILARSYYEKALAIKPEYPDALFALGWMNYSDPTDVDAMERIFREMTKIDGYDYRGFHGLGYALYMKALEEKDIDKRNIALREAAIQSQQAKNLSFSRLNIVVDFGEVARTVDPKLSHYFHQRGREILDDPVLSRSAENDAAFGRVLLAKAGFVNVISKDQKIAWVEYGLALDFLAMLRKNGSVDGQEQHDHHFQEGAKLDKDGAVYPIYEDELAILDQILPAETDEKQAAAPTP